MHYIYLSHPLSLHFGTDFHYYLVLNDYGTLEEYQLITLGLISFHLHRVGKHTASIRLSTTDANLDHLRKGMPARLLTLQGCICKKHLL